MRIVHIIPSLIGGGAERIVLDICNELADRADVDVMLVLFRPEIEYIYKAPKLLLKTIPATVRLSILRKPVCDVSALQLEIEKFKPDVIHSHLFEAELVSRSITYQSAVWFSHGHDNMVQLELPGWDMFFNKQRLTNWWERRYLLNRYRVNGGSWFIAISRDVQTFFKRVLPGNLAAITLLPNAIKVNRFKNPGVEKQRSTTLRLVNVGSFVPKKNQVFLVEVMRLLQQDGIDAHLTFLGDGATRVMIQEQAKALGVSERITFAGKVADVEAHLWQSDMYVHAALYEPFGLVLVEAMAAGLPVIAVDGRGNRDIIKQDVNGYIEPADVVTFAARIKEVAADNAKYQRLVEQGLLTAQEYDIKTYVDRLLQLYAKAVQAKKV